MAISGKRVRIYADLSVSNGWPPVSRESLWAWTDGSDIAVIDNVPFFIAGLAVGDTVQVERSDEGHRISAVLSRSGHSTVWVICCRADPEMVVREFSAMDCHVERSPYPRLLAIDVPPGRYSEVDERIMGGIATEEWEADDGFVFDLA